MNNWQINRITVPSRTNYIAAFIWDLGLFLCCPTPTFVYTLPVYPDLCLYSTPILGFTRLRSLVSPYLDLWPKPTLIFGFTLVQSLILPHHDLWLKCILAYQRILLILRCKSTKKTIPFRLNFTVIKHVQFTCLA